MSSFFKGHTILRIELYLTHGHTRMHTHKEEADGNAGKNPKVPGTTALERSAAGELSARRNAVTQVSTKIQMHVWANFQHQVFI